MFEVLGFDFWFDLFSFYGLVLNKGHIGIYIYKVYHGILVYVCMCFRICFRRGHENEKRKYI